MLFQPNAFVMTLRRRLRLSPFVVLLVLAMTLMSGAADAQLQATQEHPELHPNLRRGGAVSGLATAKAGWGTFNLFNGNLMFEAPLGHSYPVSEHFGSYRFSLRYNSNVWDFRQESGSAYADPMAASNSGLGFDLSLGRLLAPGGPFNRTGQWIFIDPDGTPHLFYSDLHWDTPDSGDPNDNFQYSRDGSYLRLKRVSSAQMDVERPDGHYLSFEPNGAEWRVTRAARRKQGGSGEWTVSYAADGSSWTVGDSHGRSHRIVFMDDPSGVYGKLVERVELSEFAGATAVYTFTYEPRTVPRHCADVRGGSLNVPLLTAITDPTGYVQTFDYWDSGDCVASGRLKEAKLMHGGFIEWNWGSYPFTPLDCSAATPAYLTEGAGVVAWRKVRPDGVVEGAWAYETELTGGASSCQAQLRVTRETTPLGHSWEYFFLAATEASNPESARYGLPGNLMAAPVDGMLPVRTVSAAAGATPLRTVFESWEQDSACSAPGGNCFDTQRRLRAQRTRYDDDPHPTEGLHHEQFDFADFDGLGHFRSVVETANFSTQDFRETYTRYNPGRKTYLSGDPASTFLPWLVTWNWDLGMYDRTELRDQPQDTKPEVAEFCFRDGEVSRERRQVGVSRSAKDLVIDHVWTGAARSEIAYYGGDLQAAPTGWLCSASFAQGLAPQYRVQRNHQAGVLAAQFFVDGSGQRVHGESDLDRDVDIASGLVAAQRDEAGVTTSFLYDLLGRRTRVHPESSQEAVIDFNYRNPTGGSAWSHGRRIMTRAFDGEDGTELRRDYRWLGLFEGKLRGTYRYRTDGARSTVTYYYNAMGWPTLISTPFNPGVETSFHRRYLNYDPWGRPGLERPPEGSGHDITYAYQGVREVVKSFKAATGYAPSSGNCSEQTVTETTQRDFLGRPRWIVEDRAGVAEGHTLETTLTHDVAGRLLVRAEKTSVGFFVKQSGQSFSYDGRGFLLERYRYAPGRSWSEDFSEIDPLGLAGRSVLIDAHHPSPGLALRHEHDRAGRLVRIADADDPSQTWKELEFGDANLADDLRRGKLVRSARFNYRYSAYVVVENEYEYRAPGGRVSLKRIGVDEGPVNSVLPAPRSYSTSVSYDPLGQVEEIQYPGCVQCAGGQPALPRTVHYERAGHAYARHLVTSVYGTFDGASASWIDDVVYGSTFQATEILHANGVTDYGEEDSRRRSRLGGARVEGSSVTYDAGPIVYDGSDAICGVGEASYVAEPTEIAGYTPPAQCDLSEVIDPFGGRTGEHSVSACNNGTEAFYYDAEDRLVGYVQYLARKQTYYPNLGWVWESDPSNWTVAWSLYGPEETGLLRAVEEDRLGNWRATADTVSAVGRPVFEQTRRVNQLDESLHLHPMGAKPTNLLGWSVAKSLAKEEPGANSPQLDALPFSLEFAAKTAATNTCALQCPSLFLTEPKCPEFGETLSLGPVDILFTGLTEDNGFDGFMNPLRCEREMKRRMRKYCNQTSRFGCCDLSSRCEREPITVTIPLATPVTITVINKFRGYAAGTVREPNDCHPEAPGFSSRSEQCCDDGCGTQSLSDCIKECKKLFGCRGTCEPEGTGYVCKVTTREEGTVCNPEPPSGTGGGGGGGGGGGDPSGTGGTSTGPIDGISGCPSAGKPCRGSCFGQSATGFINEICKCEITCSGRACGNGESADPVTGECIEDARAFWD